MPSDSLIGTSNTSFRWPMRTGRANGEASAGAAPCGSNAEKAASAATRTLSCQWRRIDAVLGQEGMPPGLRTPDGAGRSASKRRLVGSPAPAAGRARR
jgi:hypothetical protein